MNIITTRFKGATQGSRFLHAPPSGDLATSTISRIVIRHGDLIDCFAVEYSWSHGKALAQGGNGGGSTEIVFADGEYITQIEGCASQHDITQLTLITNKRTCGPYGAGSGEQFIWGPANGAKSPPATPLRLLGFSGRSGGSLHGLQAIFGQYRAKTKSARYETLSLPDSTPSIKTLADSRGAGSFTYHLMSPIITFSVGHDGIEFHAHEDTVLKLPDFATAVGSPDDQEWSNTITLPHDDPTAVSALLEYLYTGNYTYASSTSPATPYGELDEGCYHIGVYVVAAKYRCSVLADIAARNVRAVATELDGVAGLRLWRVAYPAGLRLLEASEDLPMYGRGEGLVSWVKGLFKEAGREMEETVAQCPMLACDLLRISMGN